MMTVEIFKTEKDLPDPLEADWHHLCSPAARTSPFLRPDWFKALVKSFGKRMEVVSVSFGGRIHALLPLERRFGWIHGLPARKLQGIFNLNTPRFDLIHTADESHRRDVVRELWQSLRCRSDWDVIEFRLVPTDSWLADLAALSESEGYRIGTWQMDAAPYVSLESSEDPEAALARFFGSDRKHLRQELDRRLRRLCESGNVEFIVTDEITDEVLSRYFSLEAAGWKGRVGTAVSDDVRAETLHREFAVSLARDGALRAYELRLDQRTIAMSLNIVSDDRVVHWKTSYDEEFARYAPGNLLFRRLITDCVKQGVAEIDFLSPSTPNKRVWATGEREHAAFYIFRPGPLGSALWLWKFGIGSWLRSAKQRPLSPEAVHQDR